MKTKKLVLILMGIILISNGLLFAHGGEEHDQAKSAEELTSPAAIWQNIREEEKKLGETIEAGKLEEVHEIAFAIRDLAPHSLAGGVTRAPSLRTDWASSRPDPGRANFARTARNPHARSGDPAAFAGRPRRGRAGRTPDRGVHYRGERATASRPRALPSTVSKCRTRAAPRRQQRCSRDSPPRRARRGVCCR